MKEQKRLEHLHCTFSRLTENNQSYVLGLAEGLKHSQGKRGVNITNDLNEVLPVCRKCSDWRKNCS